MSSVEAGRVQVRADRDRTPLVGDVHQAVKTLGGIEAHGQRPDVVDHDQL
jgi:hypothetical protein